MKRYGNLILSLISLFVTALLLVVTLFGWYVVNSKATASGLTAAVKDNKLIDSVTYYTFTAESVSGGVTSLTVKETNTEGLPMLVYDELNPNSTKLLIKIDFLSNANISNIQARSSASYFAGFPNSSNPGYVTTTTNLSLSSVIMFEALSSVTISGSTVSFTEANNYKHFSYNAATGSITSSGVEVLDSALSNVSSAYLILDYYQSGLSDLYGNNIGNSTFERASNITFKLDFQFLVVGSVVSDNE